MFDGMSSLKYNKMSPPFELRSSVYGVQNLLLKIDQQRNYHQFLLTLLNH